jgi:BED zinc finger
VIKKRVKKAAVVREELEHRDKRDRIYGPVTWSADSIVLSSTVLSSSVWQHFRKLDMSADGQTDPVCSQLRVCNICLEEAKNDKTINFMVEVDGSNTTKMTNHMPQGCSGQ